jgi:hypothetical protein
MVKPISAREAFELHKSAVTRDFVAKPRLGKSSIEKKDAPHLKKPITFYDMCFKCAVWSSMLTLLLYWLLLLLLLDYRTVTGVNGPLVILDNVKVSKASRMEERVD